MPILKRQPDKSPLRLMLEEQWQSNEIGDASHFVYWKIIDNEPETVSRQTCPFLAEQITIG